MYVVIVGGGATGLILTKKLENRNIDVTVIEKDVDRCDEILSKTRAHVIRGDGTDPTVLEEAELHRADYLVCVTGDDKTNILVGLIGMNMGVENIIVRVEHPVYERIARELGFTNIINPAETGATMIEAAIRGIKFIEFFKIESDNVSLEEVFIDKKSKFRNKPLKTIQDVSKDIVYPLMIIHDNDILVPDPNYRLRDGDVVWILRKRKKFLF